MKKFEKYIKERKSDIIIQKILKKVMSAYNKRRDAIYRGKSSKATVNLNRLSKEVGLPINIIDMAVGMGTMAALSGEKEAEKAIKQQIDYGMKNEI